jgi:hypothetical protein
MRDDTLSEISEALAPHVLAGALEEGRKLTAERAIGLALETIQSSR